MIIEGAWDREGRVAIRLRNTQERIVFGKNGFRLGKKIAFGKSETDKK